MKMCLGESNWAGSARAPRAAVGAPADRKRATHGLRACFATTLRRAENRHRLVMRARNANRRGRQLAAREARALPIPPTCSWKNLGLIETMQYKKTIMRHFFREADPVGSLGCARLRLKDCNIFEMCARPHPGPLPQERVNDMKRPGAIKSRRLTARLACSAHPAAIEITATIVARRRAFCSLSQGERAGVRADVLTGRNEFAPICTDICAHTTLRSLKA
jgi:hypothetical protein